MKNTTKLNDLEFNSLTDVILYKVPFVIAGIVNKDDRNPLKTLAPTLFPMLTDNILNTGMPAMHQDIPIDDDKKVSVFYCDLPFGVEERGELQEVYIQVAQICIENLKEIPEKRRKSMLRKGE